VAYFVNSFGTGILRSRRRLLGEKLKDCNKERYADNDKKYDILEFHPLIFTFLRNYPSLDRFVDMFSDKVGYIFIISPY